jgi:hypothetical protein
MAAAINYHNVCFKTKFIILLFWRLEADRHLLAKINVVGMLFSGGCSGEAAS